MSAKETYCTFGVVFVVAFNATITFMAIHYIIGF